MTDTKDKALTGLNEAIEALKPFAKMADVYDCWEDNRSGSPLVLEHAEGGSEFDCTIGDLRRARSTLDHLTTPPAPQAGEIEPAKLAFFNAWPAFANWVRSLEDGYGNKLDVDDIPSEPFEAAIRSVQAPTLTEHAIQRIILDNLKIELGKVGDHITSAHINQDSLDTVCGLLVKAPARTYADGIEDAARIVEGDIYQEIYREWPAINWGNRANDSSRVRFVDALAGAIRALATKPAGKEP